MSPANSSFENTGNHCEHCMVKCCASRPYRTSYSRRHKIGRRRSREECCVTGGTYLRVFIDERGIYRRDSWYDRMYMSSWLSMQRRAPGTEAFCKALAFCSRQTPRVIHTLKMLLSICTACVIEGPRLTEDRATGRLRWSCGCGRILPVSVMD